MLQLVTGTDADPAQALLYRPDILDVLASDLDTMGLVGETANKQLLALAMVSRVLTRPVNIVVKGASSSGKSHLVRTVAELFGSRVVLQLSSMSPRALYYMPEAELRQRVLFIDEYMPHAGRDHALRLMQSEGRLTMAVTGLEDGKRVTETRTVEGPMAFITTTTRASIFDENETRAFSIETDTSEAQTRRIHDAQRQAMRGDGPEPEADVAVWRAAMAQLSAVRVVVPYVDHIHLASTGQARDRRDLGRILSLVEASTVLHQMQRPEREGRAGLMRVADIEDYRIAWRLASTFLPAGPVADAPVEDVVAACQALGPEPVSHYQLMDHLDWSRPTVIKYCQQAVAVGRLAVADGVRGGQKRYTELGVRGTGMLTHPDEVAERWVAEME